MHSRLNKIVVFDKGINFTKYKINDINDWCYCCPAPFMPLFPYPSM